MGKCAVKADCGKIFMREKNTWSWFNTLNYNRQIGADHELNVLAGTEYTRAYQLVHL